MKSIALATGSLVALLGLSSPASAQITENFSAGHGLAPGGAYTGETGGGWTTPWLPKRPFPSVAVDRDVVDTAPLVRGGGRYLVVSGVPTSPGVWGISRQYAPFPNREYQGVRRDRSHVIRFNIRIDELSGWSRGENFTIGESAAPLELAGLGPNSAFFIRVHRDPVGTAPANSWALYNGARDGTFDPSRYVDSGIPLVFGLTYTFTVRLRPETRSWFATIEDGSRTYTSPSLGYRAGGLGTGVLTFIREGGRSDDFTTFSLDNLLIDDGD